MSKDLQETIAVEAYLKVIVEAVSLADKCCNEAKYQVGLLEIFIEERKEQVSMLNYDILGSVVPERVRALGKDLIAINETLARARRMLIAVTGALDMMLQCRLAVMACSADSNVFQALVTNPDVKVEEVLPDLKLRASKAVNAATTCKTVLTTLLKGCGAFLG